MMIRFPVRFSSFVALPVCSPAASAFGETAAREKVRAEKLDDLPGHACEMTGTVSELLQSAEAFNDPEGKVKAHLQTTLDTCEIADTTALQKIRPMQQALAFLEEDDDAVSACIEKRRASEERVIHPKRSIEPLKERRMTRG